MNSSQIHAAFAMLEQGGDDCRARVFLREVECQELRHCDFAASVQSSFDLRPGGYALDDGLHMLFAMGYSVDRFVPYDAISHVEVGKFR